MAPTPANPADSQGTRPVPDPTVMTTEQLIRAITNQEKLTNEQLEVLRERLHGIDTATKLRLEAIRDIPGIIDEKVTHLEELMIVRFDSVALQFRERDVRSERESTANALAVKDAFAAQEKQAAAQNTANQEAIRKSELATKETINKGAELNASNNKALADKIDGLKDLVSGIQLQVTSVAQRSVGGQESKTALYAALFAAVAVISLVVTIILAFAGNTN